MHVFAKKVLKFRAEINVIIVMLIWIASVAQCMDTIERRERVKNKKQNDIITENIAIKKVATERKIKPLCRGFMPEQQNSPVLKSNIRQDIISQIETHNKERTKKVVWTEENIEELTDILYAVHTSPQLQVNYKYLLSIISHESHMDIYCMNKNSDGSYDYGLGQNNSRYYKNRFLRAIQMHEEYGMTDNNVSTDKFNITTNVLASAIFLKDLRDQLTNIGVIHGRCYTQKDLTYAYNSGLSGFLNGKIRLTYFEKVNSIYLTLN